MMDALKMNNIPFGNDWHKKRIIPISGREISINFRNILLELKTMRGMS